MTKSRTKNDLITGTHSLTPSRTNLSPVQQGQALFPQKLKFPDMPQLGGVAIWLSQTVSLKAEKIQVRPSTGIESTCCVLEKKERLKIASLLASTATVI